MERDNQTRNMIDCVTFENGSVFSGMRKRVPPREEGTGANVPRGCLFFYRLQIIDRQTENFYCTCVEYFDLSMGDTCVSCSNMKNCNLFIISFFGVASMGGEYLPRA